jgi:hypothetical protein
MTKFRSLREVCSYISIWLIVFGTLAPNGIAYGAEIGGEAERLAPLLPIPAPQSTLQTVSPFTIVGFIQKATLDTPGDIFSGGTLMVNGITITVPRNTLFQMPAMSLTWQELFALAPSSTPPAGLPCANSTVNTAGLPCSTGPYGLSSSNGSQTGLALSDNPTPSTTYEVTVIGNRVVGGAGDLYIAGLIFLSQQSLNSGQGYINYIDYAKGELWVSSTLGSPSGARVRINSPVGRYGLSQTPDQRFTSDEDNPTIRSATGYPMCIARFDPTVATDSLCPQWNRPVDPETHAYQTIFTMPPPPATSPVPAAGSPMPPPDATQQAPFEVNDFITYSGTLVRDSSGSQYISAHTIVANLGIFTAPGTMPSYVAINEMLLAVSGTPNPLFPAEAVDRLRITAVSTDPTQLVDFYAIDVDACGAHSDRFYGTGDPFGPPVSGMKGRARFVATVGNFLPATREMRAASRTLTGGAPVDSVLPNAKKYANGLIAGQYHAPNFTFIFPENLVFGSPQVPFPFEEFPFLVNGSGPYKGAGNLGQISPWPGPVAPATGACGSNGNVLTAPLANAGPAQTVNAGTTVVLNGSASTDTNNPPLPLSYTWVQSAGPAVALQDAGLVKPFFTAPSVPAGSSVSLTFQLVTSNGFASSGVATTTVTVTGLQNLTVNAGANQSVQSGATVHLTGSAVDPNGASGQPLTYQWSQTAGNAVTLANPTSATPSFVAPAMTAGPAQVLSFSLAVGDALGLSGTAITNVTVQPLQDTISISQAGYSNSKNQLQVTAASNITTGAPVLTLHVTGQPDAVMTFDPTLKQYTAVESFGNPVPTSISVTSSFGGSATSAVTKLR